MKLPANLRFAIAAPLLFVLLLVACWPVDARPESATNPVGTSHTISATVDVESPQDPWVIFFLVIFGPNEGENSFIDCNLLDLDDCPPPSCSPQPECIFLGSECEPSCSGTGDATVAWQYTSNGDEGLDYILVCAFDPTAEEFPEFPPIGEFSPILFLQGIAATGPGAQQLIPEDELELFIAQAEAAGCDVVRKTWRDPTPTPTPTSTPFPTLTPTPVTADRPNLGGIFGPLPGRTATPVTQAATQATSPATVRPPSTGGAGLR